MHDFVKGEQRTSDFLFLTSGSLPGLFVAAIMKTCCRFSSPSISVRSWFTTRTLAPDFGRRNLSTKSKEHWECEYFKVKETKDLLTPCTEILLKEKIPFSHFQCSCIADSFSHTLRTSPSQIHAIYTLPIYFYTWQTSSCPSKLKDSLEGVHTNICTSCSDIYLNKTQNFSIFSFLREKSS